MSSSKILRSPSSRGRSGRSGASVRSIMNTTEKLDPDVRSAHVAKQKGCIHCGYVVAPLQVEGVTTKG